MFESLKNWGRWGADDQRGALNHLTDDRRAAAAGLGGQRGVDQPGPRPGHRAAARAPPPGAAPHAGLGRRPRLQRIAGYEAARDHLALDVHGLWTTHVDALSHMFVRGEMYGGRPASEVRSDGARSNTVLTMADGVVGRGVLLDVPRALGIDFLDDGQVVTVADLEAAEAAQGVRVGAGRHPAGGVGPGGPATATRGFDGFSGLHAECLPVAAGAGGGRARAATGSPTRCRSWAPPSGRSRSTRSASWPWASP